MRIILSILLITCCVAVQAQTPVPMSAIGYTQQDMFRYHGIVNDSNQAQKKWFVSMYSGIGGGVGFFGGGNSVFFPAQVGVQLNRRLNNNLYAFAGVSATPAFFNFNRSFSSAGANKNMMYNPAFNANGWGVYSGIQAGLMYVNDARTFSISGSIGVSNSRYPYFPSAGRATQNHSQFVGNRQ